MSTSDQPPSAAFWLIAYAFAVTMLGTTLPTPLYVIFQGQWHFSTSLITLIFASYAVAVLTALLLAGRSSDQVGRASGAGGGDLPEHRQRGDVHPRAERRLAVCRAGALWPVGRADDRHGHRRADRDGSARRRAPCVAGLVGGQPGRPRSRPAAGGAAGPVRARPDGASLRGPARAGGRGRARPAGRARDGERAFRAVPQVPRPWYPAAGPGRVHRGRVRWFRRVLPAGAVQRACPDVPRRGAARHQPRGRGGGGLPGLRRRRLHPARRVPAADPAGDTGRADGVPGGARPDRRRALGRVDAPLPGRDGGQRSRGRRRFHGQPGHGQPARPGRDARPGHLHVLRVRLRRTDGARHRRRIRRAGVRRLPRHPRRRHRPGRDRAGVDGHHPPLGGLTPRAPPARTRRTPPVRGRFPAGNRTGRTNGRCRRPG